MDTKGFPIVAVGASAGGLYALEQFFEAMPPDSGMAFVVIQHLSPDFKSLMDDILSRRTSLRIKRVENGMPVEPDTIYLIPPRSQMTIRKGTLLLRDKLPQPHFELPIDIFMQSLAEDVGDRAVGVILSGTGSDGSRGIQAIRRTGGLVMVQSPETAQFDGMPRSALATGTACFEAPPGKLPELLIAYQRNPHELNRMVLIPEAEEYDLDQDQTGAVLQIFGILRRSFGIDFSKYKQDTVQRRINRRKDIRSAATMNEYLALLANDPVELNLLHHDLLIGVTECYRDPEAFKVLENRVIPELLKQKDGGHEIRVWSAGCASGEEPYSLAIAFREQLEASGSDCKVTVFATDVYRDSLDFAAGGLYERGRLANLSDEQIARHFKKEGEELFRVVPDLRRMVVFAPHNLTSDPPFTRLDLICCRNLLIYLQQEVQERILALFHYALRPGAFLFLGSSEGLGTFENEFEAVDTRTRIYRKLRDLRLPSVEHTAPVNRRAAAFPPLQRTSATRLEPVHRQLLDDYDHILGKYIPPGVLVDEQQRVLHYFGDVNRFLKPKQGRVVQDGQLQVHDALHIAVNTALQRSAKQGEAVTIRKIRVPAGSEGDACLIDLTVDPIRNERTRSTHYHLVFDPGQETGLQQPVAPEHQAEFDSESQYRQYIQGLETELQSSRETLQATVEELQTSNEELQATNEELLAANEELQSTNEELQSINEELFTVNAEFESKNNELRRLNLDHDNLLTSLSTGVIFLDHDLRIRKFNPPVQQIFKLLQQDLGRPVDHITYLLGEQSELLRDINQVLQGGEPVEREKQLGDSCWLLYRAFPFMHDRSRIEGAILTFTDVTVLKQAEQKVLRLNEQLEQRVEERTADLQQEIRQRAAMLVELQQAKEQAEQASRTKSMFLATMSHELRNPLNSMVGFLQLLVQTRLDHEQQEYTRLMELAARNLVGVVGDVLDLSRIEAGRLELEIDSFSPSDLIASTVRLIRPQAEEKGLQLLEIYPALLPSALRGDGARIRQILTNLLSNAVKFTDQGEVSLQAESFYEQDGAHWLRFVVADTGCGIAEEQQQTIFEPFVQADGSITRRYGGSGLGLAITRHLATLMGGRISLSSVPGQGSRFSLELPLQPEQRQAAKPVAASPTRTGGGRRLQVLVADDDNLNRSLLIRLMERMGHTVTGAVNGHEVLACLEQSRPDLVLMDIEMPGLDGLAVTSAIRQAEQGQELGGRLVIIGLSARAMSSDREKAMAAGMDSYLVKPLLMDEFLKELDRLLQTA